MDAGSQGPSAGHPPWERIPGVPLAGFARFRSPGRQRRGCRSGGVPAGWRERGPFTTADGLQ